MREASQEQVRIEVCDECDPLFGSIIPTTAIPRNIPLGAENKRITTIIFFTGALALASRKMMRKGMQQIVGQNQSGSCTDTGT